MSKYTIIGDIHIDEAHLVEIENIFTEILNINSNKIVVFLGDVFHKNNPTPIEVIFALKWFNRFKQKYKEVKVILGNHDLYKNKQTTQIFKYLGITVIDTIQYIEVTSFGNIEFGHFFVTESIDNYSKNTKSIYTQFNLFYTFLGHQHRFQQITSNACHLGSIRYVTFGEYEKKLRPKVIAQINNKNEVKFIELKTPYPLVQFNNMTELLNYYGKKEFNSFSDKVRIVYNKFEDYKKDINLFDKLPITFVEPIKIKLDFNNNNIVKHFNTKINNKQLSIEEVVEKWINSISDKEVKYILEKESEILCN